MSLTQINAYVLEYVRAKKEELDALKQTVPTQNITPDTPLESLKNLGIKIKIKKGS